MTQEGSQFVPSMYQDGQDLRPMEVEHVLAPLAHAAKRLNLPAPLLNAASRCTRSTWRRLPGPLRPCVQRTAVAAASSEPRRPVSGSPYAWGMPAEAGAGAGVRVARRRWASRARAQRAATVAA
ncbi:ketopantoate reductase C-terminal domain-containing protein [Streptomyces sviceus]|uniref:ketopantoate reductase C-terminal domain-containing protein n=1 Tax=Streptomyces sviceus TaxID=285530 RepID=UPI0033210102